MHIDEMIAFWGRAKPHHPAIIQADTIITYRGLDEGIESIRRRVAQLDLAPSEPVAVAIEHPAKQIAVCFALLRSGYVTVPIYPGLMPHLRGNGISNVIYEGEGQITSGGRNIRFDASWLASPPNPASSSQSQSHNKSPDLIFFTSGSTGLPKKVVQTENALVARMHICPLTGDQNYSRILILPGLGSNFGFNRTCEVLREGKTACFALPGPSRLVLISTYCIDRIVGSPQQVLGLADLRDANPGYQMDSVRMVRIGGAFASRDAIKRVQASICRNIVTEYGSTEASLVAVGLHEMVADIPDAVGFVGPWTEIEVVDETGRPVPVGHEGRIRYRTAFFIKNFVANNPGSQGDPSEQWYYPGDLGAVTDHGVLCIRGRGDDVINCGGNKVSASSLEEIVLTCAGIKDVGICGIKGDSGMEEVWMGIVTGPDFELAGFQQELERHQNFKSLLRTVGAEVVSINHVPRNPLGKIQRHELREMILKAHKTAPAS